MQILAFIFCILLIFNSSAAFQPYEVVSSHANGIVQSVIFYNGEIPVKELLFSEDGALQRESELAVNSEYQTVWHGPTLIYYESGALQEVIPYCYGVIQGTKLSFYENGVLQSKIPYDNSMREGNYEIFSPADCLIEEGCFCQDQLSGRILRYYENGQKSYEGNFHCGVLHGEEKKWSEKGACICQSHYRLGFYHSIPQQFAYTRFYPNGKIQEKEDFYFGKPQGMHIKNHENGLVAYRCHYLNGKKHGVEEQFSQTGECLSCCKFVKGIPNGDHYQKHANGKIALAAKYNDHGALLKPIQEWDENEKKTSEYLMKNAFYEGEYLEYFANGKTKKCYHFHNGEFDGMQCEFFEDGTSAKRYEYVKGEKQGICYSWHKNGQTAKKIHYEKDKCHGSYMFWHENGQIKLEACYADGYLDGKLTKWSEDGVLLKTAHYKKGNLHGLCQDWSKEGILLSEVKYKDSVPQGTITKWHENGSLKEVIEYQNGQKEGQQLVYNENGELIFEANYCNGLLDGPCIAYYENGSLQTEEFYAAGKKVGLQLEYYPLNDKGQVSLAKASYYLNGRPHGEFVCFYPNGKRQAIATYQDGFLHGRKARWDHDDNLLEHAFYQNGKLEGKYFTKEDEGYELICHYKNNRLNGLYQVFYPFHPVFGYVKALEAEYKNGLLDGEKLEFNEAGIKMSCVNYRNGMKEGAAFTYLENGGLIAADFAKDKQNGAVIEYYSSGKVHRQSVFKNGLKQGEEKSYFENGDLQTLSAYNEGQIHGCCRTWNENGDLVYQCDFTRGKKNGRLFKYKKGSPQQEYNYQNGRLIQ